MQFTKSIKFIDLFAGIGGIRKGFELACSDLGIEAECVFTSEIKTYAVEVLKQNHPNECINGDITKIETSKIPDFDFLLGGFPCQAFSAAGKRLGFEDTRGTLFFEVERILRDKKPKGFILENVEGLVNHDRKNPKDKIGRTLSVILEHLTALGYKVNWRVLNAKDFGVPQDRKRIYITGTFSEIPDLQGFETVNSKLSEVLERGLPVANSKFVNLVLSHYSVNQLYGMSIKDKRGGENNIHSWDIDYKGETTKQEKEFLNLLLKERRKKKWAVEYGIDWMDGMPLTLEQIRSFFDAPELEDMLEDLSTKGYLKFEHPKKLVCETNDRGVKTTHREYDTTKPKGYNIVAGKLSFEINKIMSPDEIAPTLVAMDMQKLYVGDNGGLRRLTLREGLRLCGYPDNTLFNVSEKEGFDLLGNTVVVPVIKAVAERLLEKIK